MSRIMKILKILFCFFILISAVIVLTNPPKTQTNILKAILSNTEKDELLTSLSQKQSGRLNIIIETKDPETCSDVKNRLLKELSSNSFEPDVSNTTNYKQLLDTYKDHYRNLLSHKTGTEIMNNDFEAVKLESLERLYNPLGVNIIPIEKDPFFLFSDFILSLNVKENALSNENGDKFFDTFSLNLKKEIALSPSLLNKEMQKIFEIKNKIESEQSDIKIYFSGPPIHTYTASSKSITEINVISILSIIFIVLLCKLYFRSFKILIPISLSLSTGILCGYLSTALLFNSIHILTFVFSTTLIGICIDYSLHYFAHNNDINSIFKNLTASMLTTVCAFLILLFSEIGLLKQIAIFTATGLFSVYLFVILFYPHIFKKLKYSINSTPDLSKNISFSLKKEQKRIVVFVIIFLTVIGLWQIKFNDDIKNMYKPTKNLLLAEKLYSSLNGETSNTKFIVTKAKDKQSLLEQEEKLTKNLKQEDFIALSKFVPSKKQQTENLKLRKTLYKKELANYANFLPKKYIDRLINENYPPEFLTIEKIPQQISENFLLNEYQSVILVKNTNKALNETLTKDDNIIFIDLTKDISEKIKHCRTNCIKLIFPVAIVLLGLMSILYKPQNSLKIISPSFLGGFFTLSILGLLNIEVNMFHIISLFLIIGFSLDYSIFRFNDTKSNKKTKEAIFISCATTVFSFFLLALTSFKLISSIGFMISFGLISSYLLSILIIQPKQEN